MPCRESSTNNPTMRANPRQKRMVYTSKAAFSPCCQKRSVSLLRGGRNARNFPKEQGGLTAAQPPQQISHDSPQNIPINFRYTVNGASLRNHTARLVHFCSPCSLRTPSVLRDTTTMLSFLVIEFLNVLTNFAQSKSGIFHFRTPLTRHPTIPYGTFYVV